MVRCKSQQCATRVSLRQYNGSYGLSAIFRTGGAGGSSKPFQARQPTGRTIARSFGVKLSGRSVVSVRYPVIERFNTRSMKKPRKLTDSGENDQRERVEWWMWGISEDKIQDHGERIQHSGLEAEERRRIRV
ncbi:hypothetical protein PM082_013719 [Marasmius tenuissimus]|nr:hypothetical protein PM082_013719 [Marasmius tenuissimus]